MTSIMMSPLKGLSYLGQVVDYVNDGKIDANAGYNKFSYIPSVIREERGEQVNKNWGKLGDVGEFGYNLAMGMGDFAMNTIVSGGYSPIAMLIMGGGAAADTTLAAKDRGLSDDQALILGTVAGAVEAVTEKFSVEALLDPDLAADGFLKYVWKNMVTEGSEEGASNLINSFADILISGNQSQWAQSVEYYKSQGYSDAAARERALGDQARNLGLDVLGGMLTGGFLSGGYGAVNFASSRGDSRIARDNPRSNEIQALTAVAHTPQERLTLDRYKSAVNLLENRRAILLKTQQQLQQLVATGRTGSAEYNKLKSAEITLSRKVDEAQRKVESAEDSAPVKALRGKAKTSNTNNTRTLVDISESERYNITNNVRATIKSESVPKALNLGAQNKHIRGSNEYIEGRSYLYIDSDAAQQIINSCHGTGEIILNRKGEWAHKEVVLLDKVVGVSKNPIDGTESETRRVTIHYGKRGTHLVPTKENKNELQ